MARLRTSWLMPHAAWLAMLLSHAIGSPLPGEQPWHPTGTTRQQPSEQVNKNERAGDRSESDDSDDELQRLPATVKALSERLDEISAQLAEGEDLDRDYFNSPSAESLRTVTGRLHLDYWGFPRDSAGISQLETGDPLADPEDRFELRRVRIGIRGSVPPRNVSYQLELEFSGVDEIGIRDAWIGIDDVHWFNNLRIGNQKRPYALDQLNSSNLLIFLERPLINEAVNDPNRRLGIQSFGATDDLCYNWRYGIFHQVPIEETGAITSNSYQVEFASRFATTRWHNGQDDSPTYLHLALASSFRFSSEQVDETAAIFRSRPEGRSVERWLDTGPIAGAASTQLLGLETVLNVGPFQAGGEYFHVWLQRDRLGDPDLYLHGGYFYLSYFLTGEQIPWNRQLGVIGRVEPHRNFVCRHPEAPTGWGAWQIAARASVADLNDHDVLGGRGRNAALALNWYWNSHTRLQFNYIVGRIDDREIAATGEIVSGDYQIVGARMMVDF